MEAAGVEEHYDLIIAIGGILLACYCIMTLIYFLKRSLICCFDEKKEEER